MPKKKKNQKKTSPRLDSPAHRPRGFDAPAPSRKQGKSTKAPPPPSPYSPELVCPRPFWTPLFTLLVLGSRTEMNLFCLIGVSVCVSHHSYHCCFLSQVRTKKRPILHIGSPRRVP